MKSIYTILKHRLITTPSHFSLKEARSYVIGKIAYLAGALIHLVMLFQFYHFGIRPLFYFNFFSVSIFILCLAINYKGYFTLALSIAVIEVTVHQVLCVRFIGWEAGFQYILIMLLSFPFLLPKGKGFWKMSLVFIMCAVYFYLDYFHRKSIPLYQFDDERLRRLYFMNLTSTLTLVILVAYSFHKTLVKAEEALEREHQKAENLLLNILPAPIAELLKETSQTIAEGFENITVLFSDIVGFTTLSETIEPKELVSLLNDIFSRFDDLAEKHRLEKIKTIGDAYMVAAGIPVRNDKHAEAIADFALEMIGELNNFNRDRNLKLAIRIGINSGAVVAGVIGKKKFIYDLWGDSVNTASRMESHGIPGEIQVTQSTFDLLQQRYLFEERGEIFIKGKGNMKTYLLKGKK